MTERNDVTRVVLWRNRDFLGLVAASGVSAVGARITREGLPLLAVMVLHASPREIGVLAALRAAPALLVGPLCGAWVDRGHRRGILIGADLTRAVILLAVPATALTHHLSMAVVCLVGAAVGGLSSLFDMANHAFLPTVVEREAFVPANSALEATDAAGEIGGPALAGVLFSLLTAPLAIIVNSITYFASALILAGVKREDPADDIPLDHGAEGSGALSGLAIAWASRDVRPLLLLVLTAGLFGSFFAALYIPFAVRVLGLTPAMLGVTIATGGVGALLGAAASPILSRRLGVGPALIASGLAYAAATALIPLAAGPPAQGMAVLMAAQLLGDAAGTAVFVYAASLRQALLPTFVLGRVAGAFAAAGGLASIVGSLGGGWLSELIGMRGAMAVACAGLALAPVWCLASPLRLRREVGGPHEL